MPTLGVIGEVWLTAREMPEQLGPSEAVAVRLYPRANGAFANALKRVPAANQYYWFENSLLRPVSLLKKSYFEYVIVSLDGKITTKLTARQPTRVPGLNISGFMELAVDGVTVYQKQ